MKIRESCTVCEGEGYLPVFDDEGGLAGCPECEGSGFELSDDEDDSPDEAHAARNEDGGAT